MTILLIVFIAKATAGLIIAALIWIDLMERRHYRWWCEYGSAQAWRKSRGLPPESNVPPEPWFGRWQYDKKDAI